MAVARDNVTFAIISNAPAASALLEVVCDEIKKRTKLELSPLVLRSYEKLLSGMQEGDVDVAWAPPLVAIDLERAKVGSIALSARRLGKTDYSSAIFTRSDSKLATPVLPRCGADPRPAEPMTRCGDAPTSRFHEPRKPSSKPRTSTCFPGAYN
jgi:hypothetical protein